VGEDGEAEEGYGDWVMLASVVVDVMAWFLFLNQ
jgi:hypothetical protein